MDGLSKMNKLAELVSKGKQDRKAYKPSPKSSEGQEHLPGKKAPHEKDEKTPEAGAVDTGEHTPTLHALKGKVCQDCHGKLTAALKG